MAVADVKPVAAPVAQSSTGKSAQTARTVGLRATRPVLVAAGVLAAVASLATLVAVVVAFSGMEKMAVLVGMAVVPLSTVEMVGEHYTMIQTVVLVVVVVPTDSLVAAAVAEDSLVALVVTIVPTLMLAVGAPTMRAQIQ